MGAAAKVQHEANKQQMGDIDHGLDNLVDVTKNTATNATAVGEELDDQTKMVRDANSHMDVTDQKVNKATDKVVAVQKVTGCGIASYVVMGILIVLIIVLCFVPIPKLKKDDKE